MSFFRGFLSGGSDETKQHDGVETVSFRVNNWRSYRGVMFVCIEYLPIC